VAGAVTPERASAARAVGLGRKGAIINMATTTTTTMTATDGG
jgi:hypothetical protein